MPEPCPTTGYASSVTTTPPPYIAELPGYWFLLYIVFQPEVADDTSWPCPLVRAFASAEAGRTTET